MQNNFFFNDVSILFGGTCFAEDDERHLLAETRYRVGAAMRVDLEYVDRIERTATGKLRLVVSEVS